MGEVKSFDNGARESAKFLREMANLADAGALCGGTLVYYTSNGVVESEGFGDVDDGYYMAGHLMAEAMRFVKIEEEG